jgi:hypothetical protein
MQEQISNAVRSFIGTPPNLFSCERLNASTQAGPILLQQLVPGKLKKEGGH